MNTKNMSKEELIEELKTLKSKLAEQENEKAQLEEIQQDMVKSEEHYRLLVEKSQIGIFIDDKDGDFIYSNERVPEIFDMTMEQFISQSPADRILPEDFALMMEYHKLRMEGKEAPTNYEIRAYKMDGSVVVLEVNVVVLEEGGRIKGTMSYIKDITDQKAKEEELRLARDELEKVVEDRTRELQVANATLARDLDKIRRVEKALRESEDYYKRIIETLHDALLIFDPDGEIILDANQRACEMYGYPKEELIGMSLVSVTKDVEAGKKKINTTLEDGRYNNFETVHFKNDGSEIFLEVNASVVDYRGKKVIVTVFRDRTNERDDNAALKDSEKKYRTMIEHASDGVLIIQNEKVVYANPRLAQIAGTTVEEITGKPFTDYVHPEEAETLFDNYKRRMQGEVFDSIYRTRLKRADGTALDAEINAGMVTFDGKPADLVFVREIT